jgi:hypothetical protein
VSAAAQKQNQDNAADYRQHQHQRYEEVYGHGAILMA